MPRRIGVLGATGAVGGVLRDLLRDWDDVRYFASARSAGTRARRPRRRRGDAGGARGRRSRRLLLRGRRVGVPRARAARRARRRGRDRQVIRMAYGARRAARRARGERRPRARAQRRDRGAELLDDPAAGRAEAAARRGRTAQRPPRDVSVGLGRRQAVDGTPPRRSVEDHDLRGDWDFDGEEFEEEAKIHEETRKILGAPRDLPVQATCVRVPVLVGHLEAVWIETEDALSPSRRTTCSRVPRACASWTSRARSRPQDRRSARRPPSP